jgi:hypothetical protein
MTHTRSDPHASALLIHPACPGTALLAPAAPADAAKYPTITNIAPMQVAVGDTVVISGRNFISGANRTTVVFKRDGKQAVFVRAPRATKTKLTLTVPPSSRRSSPAARQARSSASAC